MFWIQKIWRIIKFGKTFTKIANQVALVKINSLIKLEILIFILILIIKRRIWFKSQEKKLLGLLRALEDIDNIIALIKASKSAAAAKDNLIEV